jgi:alkylation response protein AidB-like acyl-CoA dehydrogenase
MIDAVAVARAIAPRLAAVSAEGERLRRLHPDAVAALRESGLSRLLTPRRFGGHEAPIREQILACAELGRACSAASWVTMVCGAHTFVLGSFPEACQEEVLADPDVLIAGTLASQGTVERVDGGWRLDGRWQFASGVDHSPWLLIGARQVKDEDDADRIRNAHVVVPKADLVVDDTWYTLGMRGTGSKDLVAESVFVPAGRAMPTGALFTGTSPHARAPLYRLPVLAGLSSMLAGSVVGTAERGIELFVETTRGRRDVYGGSGKAASPALQRRIAESSAELASARACLGRICERFDAAMAADRPPLAVATRAAIRFDAAYAVELSRRAVGRLYDAAGAHAVYDASVLQRVQRDLQTASHHAIVDFDGVSEIAGRIALGLDAGTPLV